MGRATRLGATSDWRPCGRLVSDGRCWVQTTPLPARPFHGLCPFLNGPTRPRQFTPRHSQDAMSDFQAPSPRAHRLGLICWNEFTLSMTAQAEHCHQGTSRGAPSPPRACPFHDTTIVTGGIEFQPQFTTAGMRLTGEKNRVPLRPSKGAGVVKLVDTPDLGSGASAWGFESLHPHIFEETQSANRNPAHERFPNLSRRPPD